MSQVSPYLKAAAVSTAIVLVGGYIGYNAGFVVMLAGSKSSPVFHFNTAPTRTNPPATKEPAPQVPARPEPPKAPPGSKMTFNFIDNDTKQANPAPPEPKTGEPKPAP